MACGLFDHDPGLASTILRIKHNSNEVTSLKLDRVRDFDETAWRCIGYIIGRSKHLGLLNIRSCYLDVSRFHLDVDVSSLSAGLQNNRCIQSLDKE